MPRTVLTRTLSMRTAQSVSEFNKLNGGPGSFERLLRILHSIYANVPQRRVESGGQVIEARNVDGVNPGTTLLHLVAYTPDEQMPGVPNAARNAASADLILLEAPDDVEFLDGQLMAFIRENDVLLCKDGLGEAALVAYALGLARRNGMDTASLAFHLMKRADIDKIEMIRRDGIKSVSMNTVAHQTSVDHVERHNVRERITGRVIDELKAVLGMADEVPEDVENLKVEVLFTFDKREGTVVDQRQLVDLAERMVNEDDGFSIETLSGKTLRAEDVILSKPIRLPAFGKSVHHADAWVALADFYAELSEVRPVP
jgi:hypothetical protein